MAIFYSKTTNGFYDSKIHGKSVPEDAVEITAKKHAELLEAQSGGKVITSDDKGFPVTVDHQPSAEEIKESKRVEILANIEAVERKKIRAFTDFIIDGSDVRVKELETQLVQLRAELSALNG